MSELPSKIRVAAGDYFMHGQDRRMREAGLQGNVCCAVMKLDQGFDLARFRKRLAESPIMNWLARARMVRPLPALITPRWNATGAPRELLFVHPAQNGIANKPEVLPAVVEKRELHAERDPGLAFDIIPNPDGTTHLFLSWNHTHLDARGLDFLLSHLNAETPAKGIPSVQDFISPKQLSGSFRDWWPNAQKAHGSVKWLHESGKEPLFSFVPAGPRRAQCGNVYRLLDFSAEETARIDARCQQFNCGFRRSHFYLAASLRAVHNAAVQRGNKDGAYLIPVPHDTRKRGSNGPIFSNHLSILFYRIEPKFAGRLTDLLGELGRQMTDQIRDKFPECCMAALEMFKPMPLGYYATHLGKPTRGKIATLSFSDSGDTCANLPELCGGKIQDVTHMVPSWRPPGFTVLFLRFRNRLSALLSVVDDCIQPDELERMARDVRVALLEESP